MEQTRYDLALELLDDVRRLDRQLKESHQRIKTAVRASGTSLTELYGVGPVLACGLIGYTGDVRRFANRDQFAAYAGVAPIERVLGWSHRPPAQSRRGNRQLNHAIHMVAICQIRQTDSEGRIYFERKVAEGKTKREAIRSLKRQITQRRLSAAPPRRTASKGPGGQAGTTHSLRGRLCTLTTGSSAKSLPDPPNLRQSSLGRGRLDPHAPETPGNCPLDSKRIRLGRGNYRERRRGETHIPRSNPKSPIRSTPTPPGPVAARTFLSVL